MAADGTLTTITRRTWLEAAALIACYRDAAALSVSIGDHLFHASIVPDARPYLGPMPYAVGLVGQERVEGVPQDVPMARINFIWSGSGWRGEGMPIEAIVVRPPVANLLARAALLRLHGCFATAVVHPTGLSKGFRYLPKSSLRTTCVGGSESSWLNIS